MAVLGGRAWWPCLVALGGFALVALGMDGFPLCNLIVVEIMCIDMRRIAEN